MNYKVEILILGGMILYVLYEMIRINLFKKNKNSLLAGLVSLLLVGFGIYLSIKNGLILDYGTKEEIIVSKVELMCFFSLLSISIGLLFIFISIIKFVVWRVKSHLKK